MAARDKIKFVILHEPLPVEIPQAATADRDDTCSLEDTISAIVGKEAASKTATNTPFNEEDVEVTNLKMSQDQRLTMYAYCRDYFTNDAWSAIGTNMVIEEPSSNAGLILPIYTSSPDENFWLFYTEYKIQRVMKTNPNGAIVGNWLEVLPNSNQVFKLLANKEKVFGKNLIKSEHGPIYFFYHGFELHRPGLGDQLFKLPALLHSAINNILLLSGILPC